MYMNIFLSCTYFNNKWFVQRDEHTTKASGKGTLSTTSVRRNVTKQGLIKISDLSLFKFDKNLGKLDHLCCYTKFNLYKLFI